MPFWNRQTLLAKAESVYGTNPTPAAETDGVVAYNMRLQPLQGTAVTRDYLLPWFGSRETTIEGRYAMLTFEVDLQGSGTAGTAPVLAPLLLACGLTETVNADTDVTYAPSSDVANHESVALAWNNDGNQHLFLGARGTGTLMLRSANFWRLQLAMTGLYTQPAAAALPSPDLSGWIKPLVMSKANTTFSFGGSAFDLESMDLVMGNDVQNQLYVNEQRIQISDRRSTGSVTVAAKAYGTFNPFVSPTDATSYALQVVHGSVGGRIVQLDAPAVQITGEPGLGNTRNASNWTLPLGFRPDEGDDEWVLTFK